MWLSFNYVLAGRFLRIAMLPFFKTEKLGRDYSMGWGETDVTYVC